MRALFWNLGGARLSAQALRSAVATFKPDLVVLAESSQLLDSPSEAYVGLPLERCRLAVFVGKDRSAQVSFTDRHWAVLSLEGVLVSLCHLRSSTGEGAVLRREELRNLGAKIRELRPSGERSVVFGDLNLSPYDEDLVHFMHLRARQTREDALLDTPALVALGLDHVGRRRAGDREYCGTYRYQVANRALWRWATLDHALSSPDLDATMRVVDELPGLDLSAGIGSPQKERELPDHRPIVVEW